MKSSMLIIIALFAIGLILLGLMVYFCSRPNSRFRQHRAALKSDPNSYYSLPKLGIIFRTIALIMLLQFSAQAAMGAEKVKARRPYSLSHQAAPAEVFSKTPDAPTQSVANRLGELFVQNKGKITTIHPLAVEFCRQLYGADTYKELTADQVLGGYYFFYDQWKREPLAVSKTDTAKIALCRRMIQQVGDGSFFKIVPAPIGEEWRTNEAEMRAVGKLIEDKKAIEAFRLLQQMRDEQIRFAPVGVLPSTSHSYVMDLLIENHLLGPLSLAILVLGFGLYIYYTIHLIKKRRLKKYEILPIRLVLLLFFVAQTAYLFLSAYVGKALPLSNYYLMLQIAAWYASGAGVFSAYSTNHHALGGITVSLHMMVSGILLMVAYLISAKADAMLLLPVKQGLLYSILCCVMAMAIVYSLMELILVITQFCILSSNPVRAIYPHLIGILAYPTIYFVIMTLVCQVLSYL